MALAYHRLMTITAAVDGSSLGNPGPAGWAWVVDGNTWACGGWSSGTNNIGELTALLRLLEDTAVAGLADEELLVLADSQYVINSVTRWMPNWKRKGWKKADGKPVKNLELIQQLDRAMQGRKVNFQWVKGHAGHDLNEMADDKARSAAEAYQRSRSFDEGPGFPQSPRRSQSVPTQKAQNSQQIQGQRLGQRQQTQSQQPANDVQTPLNAAPALFAPDAPLDAFEADTLF